MNDDVVKLWCLKADNDFKTGKDELATENPATDTVCFHMQQCVEKYLKAFLVYKCKEITKTHNIALLLQRCIDIDSTFDATRLKIQDFLKKRTVHNLIRRFYQLLILDTLSHSARLIKIINQCIISL